MTFLRRSSLLEASDQASTSNSVYNRLIRISKSSNPLTHGLQSSSKTGHITWDESFRLTNFRGAVLSQLPQEAAITSTVATKHYGVSASAVYSEAEDSGQPTSIHRFDGKRRVQKVRLSEDNATSQDPCLTNISK